MQPSLLTGVGPWTRLCARDRSSPTPGRSRGESVDGDQEKTNRLDEFADMVLGQSFRPPKSNEFLALVEAKLDHGTRKYGPGSWRHHDMIRELLSELIDSYNYPYLIWRVLLEQGVDKSHPQLFLRIARQLEKTAADAFTAWAALSRMGETLDAAGIPRSVTGENRVSRDARMTLGEAIEDDPGATAAWGSADEPAPDAGDDRGPGSGGGSGEVPAAPAGAAESDGPGHEGTRPRRRSSSS
jgi:hypothetical protein